MHSVEFFIEDNLVEFRHHLTAAECSQAATLSTRWTLAVFFGNVSEVSPAFDLRFQFQTGGFVGNQDVSSGSGRHNKLSERSKWSREQYWFAGTGFHQ